MNNKAFTLVELLAIMLIISAIIAIVFISVGPIIKNYEKNLSKTQISIIEEAANIYYLKEGIKKSYENRNFKLCVNVEYLIEHDYIEDESIKSMYDNKKLDGSVEITYKSEQHTYKYRENSCNYEYQAVDPICTAVTESTKTTGNIPKGKYLPGDEYICEVKNKTKYHFFVFGTDDDNVNLIMDRNMYYDEENGVGDVATEQNKGIVAWQESGISSEGPVTAMTYLYNATKDWNNVPVLNYEYNDKEYQGGENGYTSFISKEGEALIIASSGSQTSIGTKEYPLRVRMPIYAYIDNPKYSELDDSNGNNEYLYEWLDGSDWKGNENKPKNNITGINGYWTLSTSAYRTNTAWMVHFHGNVYYEYIDKKSSLGVRPVISIPKLDIAN